MTFDAARNRTVLFGGAMYASAQAGDTWEWTGTGWSQISASGPSARWGVAVAHDGTGQRTVLFGGWDGAYRADTWTWNGANWVPQLLAGAPPARERHAMVFDSLRGRVVLFGGQGAGSNSWLSDTWEWNGTTWLAVGGGVSPAGRAEHAMAFDSQRGRTVLFGGIDGTSSFLGDTWEWDGSVWSQVSNSGPPARSKHAMAFDSNQQRVLLVGGHDSPTSVFGGMWTWDGGAWQAAAAAPPARVGPTMVYDNHRGRMVLFGGFPWGSDTWELVSTGASATPYGTGCGSPPLALSAVSNAPPSLGSTAQAALTAMQSTLGFVALGVSNTAFGPFSLPASLAALGMPGCLLLQSAEVLGEPTTAVGVGAATYSFAIPNNSALIGFHLYLQGWSWAPGANAANVIMSNGLDWQVGM